MSLLMPVVWMALGATVPLTGTVEDPGGKPVEGATVWLADAYRKAAGEDILAKAETDAQGRFRLDRDEGLAGRGASWSPTLWAYRPGSRIGFVTFKGRLPGPD